LQDENFSTVTPDKLHNPVGLDIGADSPEQIALSILAEIQAVAANHAGGLLCEKRGPIHAPRRTEPAVIEPAVLTSNGEDALCAASL
jgi:xanthine/CO dehydrogenase XdhC/CoxF family maturation factor